MNNIWEKLAKKAHARSGRGKPFFVLAPMAGVTDFAFREIITEIGSPAHSGRGKPDLIFTEFISTEMVYRIGSVAQKNLPLHFKYSKKQHPIIVQFFGCKSEQFEYCARLALKLGFDGIDINMGCPDRKVQKQGAGSELINNPELAREIIRATKKGCEGKIPVSIKTRLGYRKKDIENWIFDILKEGVSAITIHGRHATQGYQGSADWEIIGEISKKIREKYPDVVIIGNGDIKSIEQGKEFAKKYDVDGVMIGREVMHNPWVFKSELDSNFNQINPNIKERIKTAIKHTEIFSKIYKDEHTFSAMKKYYKAYLSGFEGAVKFRAELMQTKNAKEAIKILKRLIKNS